MISVHLTLSPLAPVGPGGPAGPGRPYRETKEKTPKFITVLLYIYIDRYISLYLYIDRYIYIFKFLHKILTYTSTISARVTIRSFVTSLSLWEREEEGESHAMIQIIHTH